MTRTQSQVAKAVHGSRPGSIRVDERPRISSFQSLVLIAPRPFVYDALQSGEIRVMDISPSRDRSAPIRAMLKHQPLRYGTYEALSCALKSEEQRATIDVNGQTVTVSSSLLEALRDIRRETEARTLWIDSICVNQNDREEREEQRRRIADIFGYATRTIEWPGDTNGQGIADATILNQWLTADVGKTPSPPTWNLALLPFGGIGSEHLFDVNTCQPYFESPPALTSSPGSPQTNSASTSPESIAEFHFQATPSLKSLPLHPGDADFWAPRLQASGVHQLSSGDETQPIVTSTSQRKRSLLTAFPDDTPAPCNQKIQHTQSISGDNNEKGFNVVFACPFQKFDPHKYHKCLKYTLNRIKDVKQHIYRQHMQRPYYCARCYEFFATGDERDEHSRRADCKKRQAPQSEGITDDQRNELKKSSPRKKPLHEQWFEVWDVVFPGCQRPQSAFIGNYVEEMVPLLRELWNEKSAEIISGVIDTRGERAEIDRGLLAGIMDSVFDRFEAEKARASQGNSVERTGSLDDTSFQFASQESSDFCFELEPPFGHHGISHMVVPDIYTGCSVDLGNYYFSRGPDSCG
ncbi:hypothetical protein LA080_001517 [Diaporthe eres]|uniref:Heterokaryon incompatibility domain-containing protein n=1 Tax=Diaporthe vaccinii TaxID=105482 RepID=A0ABR4EVE9_9PEZI|nr:hypothetical protein LA080_001517 [Diaporthe eres]